MTKDLVIKARKDFGDNPIKVTCDNMITFWDNTAKNPKVIWDDAKETVTIFRETTEDIQEGYPLSVLVCDYDEIQYIEGFFDPKNAMEWLENNGSKFRDDSDREKAKELCTRSIVNRGYTGTRPMSNINPQRRY